MWRKKSFVSVPSVSEGRGGHSTMHMIEINLSVGTTLNKLAKSTGAALRLVVFI